MGLLHVLYLFYTDLCVCFIQLHVFRSDFAYALRVWPQSALASGNPVSLCVCAAWFPRPCLQVCS